MKPVTRGFALSPSVKVCDDGRSLMGSGRVLHLSAAAAAVVARAPVVVDGDAVGLELAERLLDGGYADPWWPDPAPPDSTVTDVTVVVPTRDRAGAVAALLAALPPHLPVVVVDDGSAEPDAVAAVAAEHGAVLVPHAVNRGPAAARNTGLRAAATPFVAFCDSDVRPVPGWLGVLRRHLDDERTAIAAPRVVGPPGRVGDSWVTRYEADRSSLDLGPTPAAVRVHGAVAYLPSACLLVRRSALVDGFDEDLRAGEDVDLVWRLVGSGWRVRYEPAARVQHEHRVAVGSWLSRKAFYGTSAAPLARRHPGSVAPVVLTPWTAVWSLALLAQRRWSLPVALAALGFATASTARRLERSERPVVTAATLTAEGAVASTWQVAASLVRHHWPLALAWAAVSPRGRRALVLAAVGEGLADRRRVRSGLGVVPYVVAHRLDDAAYGAGLWWGAMRDRSPAALLPVIRWPRRPGRRRTGDVTDR